MSFDECSCGDYMATKEILNGLAGRCRIAVGYGVRRGPVQQDVVSSVSQRSL